MSGMIDFGIDLGTTNSLIAKFESGQVDVFKNPVGFRETLPSVVGFRKERILVGDAARSYVERDPSRVASRFKRKMGTTETINLRAAGSKTPVDLSTEVLKELKTFVYSGESVEAAVITIPASFDTVQSNATKQAGVAAGFREVVLLQEPIAASLAFANREQSDLRNSTWMVYDLGGGTFDVALVRIVEGELTVVDHEGDNFLGGMDFDQRLVEDLIVPVLERKGRFEDLLPQMKSARGRRNRLWYRLLHMAEEAKVELSAKTAADIDLALIGLEDDDGNPVETDVTITRTDFEAVIKGEIDRTAGMVKTILTRNALRPSDLRFVLMVGGSTYIPYVRQRIGELLEIPVNTSIDPTNAIVVGAAYFVGSKEFRPAEAAEWAAAAPHDVQVRTAYNRNSQEQDEPFMARVKGDLTGLLYRITGADGAFDSGLREVTERIIEDLPLRDHAYNRFEFRILDSQGNQVYGESVQIAQGRYSVAGQMLPEDISLVKDDPDREDVRLDPLFEKNHVLPTRIRRTVEIGKDIAQGSDDEVRIIVVEGSNKYHPWANKTIGNLIIKGTQIRRDLFRRMDLDLTFEMSESRDLTVRAYVDATGEEFSEVFSGQTRHVESSVLEDEVWKLERRIDREIAEAEQVGNAESVSGLKRLLPEVDILTADCRAIAADDVTDDRFKLEDRTRRVVQQVWSLTSSKRVDGARSQYAGVKKELDLLVQDNATDGEKQQYREVVDREKAFLDSSNPERIEEATTELERLRWQILFRVPKFLVEVFNWLQERGPAMNDAGLAKQLFESGRRAIERRAWDELGEINQRLANLLPSEEREVAEDRFGFTNIV